MKIILYEYNIKEAIMLWLENNGIKLKVKYLPSDVSLKYDDHTGSYYAEINADAKGDL